MDLTAVFFNGLTARESGCKNEGREADDGVGMQM